MTASQERSTSVGSVELVVAVQGMTRRYGSLVAAEDVTFEVRRGEMFGLIGPDGAGKTTTLRVVIGLLAPNAGTVRTCGLEPVKQGALLSQKIGYLSQRFSLYGDLTVDENISFFASIHGVKGWKPRRDELLDLLRMTPFRGRLADRLSGGMKQKLALACTLIHTPELLVLDEPTSGVDPVSRRDFWKILAHLQRDGLTLLATTPYLDEAERCQRIALMDHGRLLTVDAPAHLKQESEEVIVEILARPKRQATERLREQPEVADVQSFGERLHATLKGVDREGAEAAASRLAADLKAHGVEVESVRPVLPTLEDIFIARIEAAEPEAAAAVR
jgi:ABC-2 type transport system ATP-binding protein